MSRPNHSSYRSGRHERWAFRPHVPQGTWYPNEGSAIPYVLQRSLLPRLSSRVRLRPDLIRTNAPRPAPEDPSVVPDRGRQVVGGPRSARSKLIRLIVVTLVTLTVLVGASVAGLGLLHHRVTVLADEVAPETAANAAIRVSMLDAETGLRSYLLTGKADFLQPYRSAVPLITQNLTALESLAADDPELAPLVTRQRVAAQTWLTAFAAPIAAGTVTSADLGELDRSSAAFDSFRQTSDQISRQLRSQTESLVTQSRLLTEIAIALILVVGVGGKAMVIRPGLRALRFIGPPLEALHATARISTTPWVGSAPWRPRSTSSPTRTTASASTSPSSSTCPKPSGRSAW